MEPVTATLGALSIGAQIFNAIRGGRANQSNYDLLKQQQNENEKFYNLNVKQDFMETNAAKGIFERLRDQFREQNQIAANSAAVTGDTPEAELAAKSQNQENYNEAVNNIASQATGYQQNQEAIYRGTKQNLTNQEMELNAQKAGNAANAAANAADVLPAAAALTGFEGLGKESVLPPNPETLKVMGNVAADNIASQQNRWLYEDKRPVLAPMPTINR